MLHDMVKLRAGLAFLCATAAVVVALGAGTLLREYRTGIAPGVSEPIPTAADEANSAGTVLGPAGALASPSPQPWAPADTPAVLGRIPAAGVIEFQDGSRWRYSGATGSLDALPIRPSSVPADGLDFAMNAGGDVAYVDGAHHLRLVTGAVERGLLPEAAIASVHWSADGRLLGLAVRSRPGASAGMGWGWWAADEFVILDPGSGASEIVYRAPDRTYLDVKSSPAVTRSFTETFAFATWSPDRRFVALWRVPEVSGSIDADGRQLLILDRLKKSAPIDLGTTLMWQDWLVWRAPHTLAYVFGASRFITEQKRVRLWSVEQGIRDVSASTESAIAPVWSSDGRLLFSYAPVGPYDPKPYFMGVGVGYRRLAVVDPISLARTELPAAPGFFQQAVFPSPRGDARLELRQPLVDQTFPANGVPPRCELWYVTGDAAQPLVRLRSPCYAFYSHASLAGTVWNR